MYDQLRLIFKLKFPKHVLEKRIKSTILADSDQQKAKIGAKMMSRKYALPRKGMQSASAFPFCATALSLERGKIKR